MSNSSSPFKNVNTTKLYIGFLQNPGTISPGSDGKNNTTFDKNVVYPLESTELKIYLSPGQPS